MYHYRDLAGFKPERRGYRFIVYLVDNLHFEKVVAASERAGLVLAAFVRARRNIIRIRALYRSLLLGTLQVLLAAVAVFHDPTGAFDEKLPLV